MDNGSVVKEKTIVCKGHKILQEMSNKHVSVVSHAWMELYHQLICVIIAQKQALVWIDQYDLTSELTINLYLDKIKENAA